MRALRGIDAGVASALVLVIRTYQLLVSPLIGPVCRFAPSCSSYGVGALRSHGAVRGCVLTGRRLLRCHPWAAGGWDPVPGSADAVTDDVGGARPGDPRHSGHVHHDDDDAPARPTQDHVHHSPEPTRTP